MRPQHAVACLNSWLEQGKKALTAYAAYCPNYPSHEYPLKSLLAGIEAVLEDLKNAEENLGIQARTGQGKTDWRAAVGGRVNQIIALAQAYKPHMEAAGFSTPEPKP